jgi:ubiquinone/menaquinone biosynthesis C-methylase UbiE
MRHTVNGFDRLASHYDRLARLIFGKSIVEAQTCFLGVIPPFSNVLILGGGTGWLLAELLQRRPKSEVWYIESSANMLTMAMEKSKHHSQVHFILGTEKDIPTFEFDIVIAPFFLDLFSPPTLQKVIERISLASKPSTLWMIADFVNQGKWWQRFLLKVMYSFFRQVCRIEAHALPPWAAILDQSGLAIVDRCFFYGGFIESAVYRLESQVA